MKEVIMQDRIKKGQRFIISDSPAALTMDRYARYRRFIPADWSIKYYSYNHQGTTFHRYFICPPGDDLGYPELVFDIITYTE